MADGVTLGSGNNTSPTDGTKIATDDLGAAGHVQLVALVYSDSSGNMIPAGANGLAASISAGTVTLGGVSALSASVPGSAIAYGTASGTALAPNSSRLGFNIVNAGTATLYVSFAGTATTTNWVERLETQYDRLSDGGIGLYAGLITMVGSAAGTAIVTEW